MRTKLFLLLLLLTGCGSIKEPYVIIEKKSYRRSYNDMLVVLFEYTYYSGNGVKVYHCTNREYEVGDTLKSNVIEHATYRDHLFD